MTEPAPFRRFDIDSPSEAAAGLAAAVNAARAGELVVFPTDTVYGLGTDAFSRIGTHRIREAKGRGRDVPIPVLIAEATLIETLGQSIGAATRELCARFWPGGLTVIVQASSSLNWDLGENETTVALRVPDHAFARELLAATGPMAVSSANTHGREPAKSAEDAYEMLGETVSVYLEGGAQPIGAASTIVDVTGRVPAIIRVGAISVSQIREVVSDTALRRANNQVQS